MNKQNNSLCGNKTRICNYYINCSCKYNSNNCNFAHGFSDYNFIYCGNKYYDEYARILRLYKSLFDDYYILLIYSFILYNDYNDVYLNELPIIKTQFYCIHKKMRHLIKMLYGA